MAEDEPIQHGIISRSLESAQRKIEGFHFDSRKHVFWNMMMSSINRDSKVYDRRRKILQGEPREIQAILDGIIFKSNSRRELQF